MRKQKSSETRFDRFLLEFGTILAFQNGAKTFKNRFRYGIKICLFFEGLLEHQLFKLKRRQERETWEKISRPGGMRRSPGEDKRLVSLAFTLPEQVNSRTWS